MSLSKKNISAITLLDVLIEFEEMTYETEEWSFEAQKNNPPRLIRLQQIDVMLKKFIPDLSESFSIKKKMVCVLQGTFIDERKNELYTNVFGQMDDLLIRHKSKRHSYFQWITYHLKSNYLWILEYKRAIRKMKNYTWGNLEISYPYMYSNLLIASISKQIDSSEVDQFLASVIDPFNQVFTKSSLIKKDGYPSADINEVDKEWV